MSSIYRTLDGDMLDAICKARLGSERHVPAVLDANPGLAALGPVYPAGILILLPDVVAPTRSGQIRLWGADVIPAFSILVDGEDRSAVIGDRLLSLLVTDEDGSKADRVEIELDNRDGRIAFPQVDSGLQVSLGFQGFGLSVMGAYSVDGVSGRGPVRALTITATAADLKGDIRAPRTRAWTDRSLAEIAATIAGEAGLKPVIGESLRALHWPYLAQTAESNLHFLTRIAGELDATCKPAGGALVVQRRGEGRTAAGDTLVPPRITPRRLSDWSWSWKGRTVYRAAEAEWTETGTGVTHKIKVGSGTPLKKIRHPYATEAEATRAASSALSGAGRSGLEVSGTLAGFEPGLLGGGLIDLQGLEPVLDGRWHLKSVSHRLDGGGLVTEFQAEKGKDDGPES